MFVCNDHYGHRPEIEAEAERDERSTPSPAFVIDLIEAVLREFIAFRAYRPLCAQRPYLATSPSIY